MNKIGRIGFGRTVQVLMINLARCKESSLTILDPLIQLSAKDENPEFRIEDEPKSLAKGLAVKKSRGENRIFLPSEII